MFKKIAITGTLMFAAASACAATFELASQDLAEGKAIPEIFTFNDFGCKGGNVSPELNWNNAPAGTKSFALMMHDPDARTGVGGFRHWVVINIPASAKGIARGAAKAGSTTLPGGGEQITTDFGTPGWGGPCPPAGEAPHRYQFTVYALKVDQLALPPNATAGLAGFMVNMNAIGQAGFTSTYGR